MQTQHDPNKLVGTVLGSRFEVTACVAIDEAGARYDAMDRELGSKATIRVLHRIRPDDASLRRLLELLTEVSSLSVPGVKPLRAVGRTRTRDVYYATDFMEGTSLAQRVERGPLNPQDAVQAIAQAGETLSVAHSHGVVHGALHPGALVLPADAKGGRVHLLDFGLGPLVMAADILPLGTRSASTPYQSPEQAKGDPFDHHADIYALGALLYEALTGRPPFAGRSALEILAHQLRGEAPSLAEVEPMFEGSPLQEIIDNSMKVEPEDRYESVGAMVRALLNAGRAEATRKKPVRAPKRTKAPGAKSKARPKPTPKKLSSATKKVSSSADSGGLIGYLAGGAFIVAAIVLLVLWQLGVIFQPEPEFAEDDLGATSEGAETAPAEEEVEEPTPTPSKQRPSTSRETASRSSTSPPPVDQRPQDRAPLPERAQKLVSEAQEALLQKRYGRAITRFRQAKRVAPRSPEVARGLGLALMYSGNTREAAAELERYLALDPNAPDKVYIQRTIRTLRH